MNRKIEIASEGLNTFYSTCFYKIPLKENALALDNYIISLMSEVNPSDNYRKGVIYKISRFSIYNGGNKRKKFKTKIREAVPAATKKEKMNHLSQ